MRRLWPDIVDATKLRRRLAWMHLTQNCQVVAVDATTLTLGFANAGARDSFVSAGCDEVLRQAAIDVVGADWKIETIVDPGAQAAGQPTITRPATDSGPAGGSGQPAASEPAGRGAPSEPPAPQPPAGAGAAAAPAGPRDDAAGPAPRDEPSEARRSDSGAIAAARGAIQQTRSADQRPADTGPDWAAADADAHPDDLDAEHHGMSTTELLERELGARMIEEIRHQ